MARPHRMEELTLSRRKKFSGRTASSLEKFSLLKRQYPLPRACPGQKAPDSTTAEGHTVISTIFLVSVPLLDSCGP